MILSRRFVLLNAAMAALSPRLMAQNVHQATPELPDGVISPFDIEGVSPGSLMVA